MEQILESLSVLFIPPFTDTLSTLLWCAFLAVLGSLIYLFYRRATFGAALRLLMEKGCHSPETALPACELTENRRILKALDSQERLIAKASDQMEEALRKEKGACQQQLRYYIPQDRQKKAEYFFKASSGKAWQIVLAVLGLYLTLVLLYYFLPGLLNSFSA